MVFEFAESRAGSHPLRYLQKHKGYLQANAYSGHDALYETGDIVEIGCWAHCRRRFFEIAKAQSKPGLAAQALQWIARLYAIESRTKDHTPDIKYAARQTEALPVLKQFRQWLEGNVIGLPTQAPLAKAFGYALGHWPALVATLRTVFCYRTTMRWSVTFARLPSEDRTGYSQGSARGARAAATMYSLIGTARLNAIEPYSWLERTLEQLPSYPVNRVHELLPFAR
ncbi:hypothetical protein OKW45_006886 [Paraburkholderia sp. WSM4175]